MIERLYGTSVMASCPDWIINTLKDELASITGRTPSVHYDWDGNRVVLNVTTYPCCYDRFKKWAADSVTCDLYQVEFDVYQVSLECAREV